jgi:hypothetical protein
MMAIHGMAWTGLPVPARVLVIHYSVSLVHTFPPIYSGHIPDMDVEGFSFHMFKCSPDYGTTCAPKCIRKVAFPSGIFDLINHLPVLMQCQKL